MEWNVLFISKLQLCNRWMYKKFNFRLYWEGDYLFTLGLKLIRDGKRGPGQACYISVVKRLYYFYIKTLWRMTICIETNTKSYIHPLAISSIHNQLITGYAFGWTGYRMMTSSNGTIFRVTGPLCGEFTGHRWIPLVKASDVKLWCFLLSALE